MQKKRVPDNMYQPSDFIPKGIKINEWSDLEPFFKTLLSRQVNTVDELETYITH